jgi:hypothetical protein
MTAIKNTHLLVNITMPRRLHDQLERRVPHSSTLRSTVIRDLERYYWLMGQYGDYERHDDHATYLLALAEVDLPTRTLEDRRAYTARARVAVEHSNLHLVYSFDLAAFERWLDAETAEPITFLSMLDFLDCMRNRLAEVATSEQ